MSELDVDFNIAEKEVHNVALFKFFARHNKKFTETTSLRGIERQTYFGVILSVGNTKENNIIGNTDNRLDIVIGMAGRIGAHNIAPFSKRKANVA